jgi:hypothetical protein
VGVEQQEQGVVVHRLALRRHRPDGIAVQEDPDRSAGHRPVAPRHAATIGTEPPDVRQAPLVGLAAEERVAPHHGVVAPEPHQPPGEVEQRLVARPEVPVVPGDLVVLAVRVVVALLAPARLVAAEQHRDAPTTAAW